MSPLARIRQAAACSAFGFFAGLALGAMGLTVGGARVATAADAPAQATGEISVAQAPAQPTPAQTTAATSAAQAPTQSTPAQAAATPPAAATSTAAQAPQPVQLAPNAAAQIGRSALLTIEGTATADALQLSIRRMSDQSLVSSDDVTVSVDGKNQSVTHAKGGVYELPINDLRGDGARDVDVTVAHDGIREIVSGKVSVAEASSTQSLLRDHKQVAWWILNIVIILIAATAISRRKS
jgi:hypothetical protein